MVIPFSPRFSQHRDEQTVKLLLISFKIKGPAVTIGGDPVEKVRSDRPRLEGADFCVLSNAGKK
jgi:hypothetical protein